MPSQESGNKACPEASNGIEDTNSGGDSGLLEKPIHTERHMRIICIGAGASGLLLAYKLQRSFSNFTLTVYDKNPEVSGTWYENRYPG